MATKTELKAEAKRLGIKIPKKALKKDIQKLLDGHYLAQMNAPDPEPEYLTDGGRDGAPPETVPAPEPEYLTDGGRDGAPPTPPPEPPAKVLKIVQFAAEDLAGVADKIRHALIGAGHECRSVVDVGTYLQYPTDLSPTDPIIPQLVEEADVIICHNFLSSVPGWGSAKRFYYVHGTRFRQHSAVYLRRAAKAKARVLCSTPDLLRHSSELTWNPTPIDQAKLSALWNPTYGLVVHSPTSRIPKGTPALIRGCNLAGVDLDIIEKVSNADCLKRKAKGFACFDSAEIGLQVSGIEAMAFGMPVLTGGDKFVLDKVVERAGIQPYAWCIKPAKIAAQLTRLKNDEKYHRLWAARSERYIRENHAYPAAAKFMVELFEST